MTPPELVESPLRGNAHGGFGGAGRRNGPSRKHGTALRPDPTTTTHAAVLHCADAGSRPGSPAAASSPASGWAAIASWWSGRWRGWWATGGCRSATSAAPTSCWVPLPRLRADLSEIVEQVICGAVVRPPARPACQRPDAVASSGRGSDIGSYGSAGRPRCGAWLIRSSPSGVLPRSTTRWTPTAVTWTPMWPWWRSWAPTACSVSAAARGPWPACSPSRADGDRRGPGGSVACGRTDQARSRSGAVGARLCHGPAPCRWIW